MYPQRWSTDFTNDSASFRIPLQVGRSDLSDDDTVLVSGHHVLLGHEIDDQFGNNAQQSQRTRRTGQHFAGLQVCSAPEWCHFDELLGTEGQECAD